MILMDESTREKEKIENKADDATVNQFSPN